MNGEKYEANGELEKKETKKKNRCEGVGWPLSKDVATER